MGLLKENRYIGKIWKKFEIKQKWFEELDKGVCSQHDAEGELIC
jgi:hypothetical protein